MAASDLPALRLDRYARLGAASALLRELPAGAAPRPSFAPAAAQDEPPPRVLYISDSLGAPTHPRGIFNFSVAMVEMLRTAGLSVDLVVEGSVNHSLEGRFGGLAERAPDAVNSVRLAEIHRYFGADCFSFRWDYPASWVGRIARRGRRALSAWLRLRDRLGLRPAVVVRNDPLGLDYTPARSEHLDLFDRLVVKRDFYSSSMSRANLGLPPPEIDASGYDLAVVDTPHYIRLRGLAPERTLAVIHDLIPLRDPATEAHWRNLFIRKLEATLALRAQMVFVSRCTREGFYAAFPRQIGRRDYVIAPAMRSALATPGRGAEAAELWAKISRAEDPQSNVPGLPAGFDPALPYFVTAASDEARKNIATLLRAFCGLRGRANLVVLGRIDATRYDASANVVFPGYVGEAEKIDWLRGARGVVFASLCEGFGIPIVEGAAMNLPVLCSDLPVFREVAGDDASFFDPRDPAALARAVDEVLADPDAARVRAAALRRSVLARYSQEAVGHELWAALSDLGVV